VYILEDQLSVSSFCRYVTRVIQVDDIRNERPTVDAALEVGHKFGLKGWILFPTRDEHVAAFSRYRKELSEFFRVTTPDWETTKWAWDKKNSYELAEKLGIPIPRTWSIRSSNELQTLYGHLPLAIKPSIKENFFYATQAKAWRANTPKQLHQLFEKAAVQIRAEEILIQEIVPGDGNQQYSYCAFWRNGHVHSSLVARRLRQHPREFGRAATYVETTEMPLVEELSARFLKSIDFYGLVEIEFKHDLRDGRFKLLDINARTWGFHSIGLAAGVDFPYLLFADQVGLPMERSRGKVGVGWLRLLTDLPTAFSDLVSGRLTLHSYIKSLKNTRIESVFSLEDPLPLLSEIVLSPYLMIKKYF
jgi:predicted ATP-grasp superfamily ATP-dependent carboligase